MLNELKEALLKMWNNSSKVDIVALGVITLVGLVGYSYVAAGIAFGMFVYHSYLAYNNASKL